MRRKLFSAMLAITLLQAAPALAEARALFGAPSTESNDLTPFPKWTGVVGRYIAESATPWQGCAGGRCAGPYFKAIVAQLREQKDPVTALALVNQWFNAIPYVQDQDNWGVSDYWQTPREFILRGGDCEDYAISKYLALRGAGWPASALRIVVLNDRNLGVLHSILAVTVNGKNYILDNQITQLVPDSTIRHYSPIFSINEQAWWRYQP